MIYIIILLVVALVIAARNIRIVPQTKAYIVERLGVYHDTWEEGLHFKIPFIDKVVKVVNLKEQVVDFPESEMITKDNVQTAIDSLVYFCVTDPKLYCYGVERPLAAIEGLTSTTLRATVGDMELDEILTSRDAINARLRKGLDEATDPWGIKVTRVEIKNVQPSKSILKSMELQASAERERREKILKSEGEKKALILEAEGRQRAVVLESEAKKQAEVLAAEAEAQAITLRAEAERKRIELEAEGQAAAILKIQEANAEGIRMLKEAGADEAVLRMRSLEAFEKAADGQATKIIIPSEIQNMAGYVTALAETVKEPEKASKNS